MNQTERMEFRELISDVISPLVQEFRSANEQHTESIKRLFRQSEEHYNNIRDLEDKMQKQILTCQASAGNNQGKMGERIGEIEKTIVNIDTRLQAVEESLENSEESKKFNISQWLVVVGFAVMVALQAWAIYGGQ